MTPTDSPQVVIDQIASETLTVPIVGTAPLLVNKFSEKAKRQMLDNMQGRKSPKQAKDPKAEYEAAFYMIKDGTYGFPAIAFKAATVSASRFYGKSVTQVGLRQCIFFTGEPSEDGQQMVRIDGEPLRQLVLMDMEREWKQLKARYGAFAEFAAMVADDLEEGAA